MAVVDNGVAQAASAQQHQPQSNGHTNGTAGQSHDSGVGTPVTSKADSDEEQENEDPRFKRLSALLRKSKVYSEILSQKMQKENAARAMRERKRAEAEAKKKSEEQEAKGADGHDNERGGSSAGRAKGRTTRQGGEGTAVAGETDFRKRDTRTNQKRKGEENRYELTDVLGQDAVDEANKKRKAEDGSAKKIEQSDGTKATEDLTKPSASFKQPALVTGATLRDYQLRGVEWLVGLFENGINGILADEMGLGKTLQTIAFICHLKSRKQYGPYLVICPASTLHNWESEIRKFAPQLVPIVHHGGDKNSRKHTLNKYNYRPKDEAGIVKFPIFLTTYELAINDARALGAVRWKFIVVDEGHRLKNKDAKLTTTLNQQYMSDNRLILTGTPVHNNLAELWSLLNFALPDIFSNLEEFESWFDFSEIQDEGGSAKILSREQSESIVTKLRGILEPFILQRHKKDVERDLPPKKEYTLYAPLTVEQKDFYDEVLNNSIRARLLETMTGMPWSTINQMGTLKSSEGWDPPLNGIEQQQRQQSNGKAKGKSNVRSGIAGAKAKNDYKKNGSSTSNGSGHEPKTKKPRRSALNNNGNVGGYNVDDETEKQFMDRMEQGRTKEHEDDVAVLSVEDVQRMSRESSVRDGEKIINNMKLNNPIMQLRKVCGHPFLLHWPRDPTTGELVLDDRLINASGKMLMLNRLLDALFVRGHKVLLFSQFTTMLDIIEDWANDFKKINTLRLDGNTAISDRKTLMDEFNNGKGPNACNLFLLSTRAGGLGVNLVGADTVIFYDTDWNPQMDRQAQDRAHRIGQKKPVLVFRLVTRDTAEEKILKRASAKQELSALVLSGDQFSKETTEAANAFTSTRGGVTGALRSDKSKAEEWADMLEALKAERIEFELADKDSQIISDEQLETLLDRRPEAFEKRNKGWLTKDVKTEGVKPAFEVTDLTEQMEASADDSGFQRLVDDE